MAAGSVDASGLGEIKICDDAGGRRTRRIGNASQLAPETFRSSTLDREVVLQLP
jgi:hypothetical protein